MGEQEQGVVGCLMRGIMDALLISSISADVRYVLKMHGDTVLSTYHQVSDLSQNHLSND